MPHQSSPPERRDSASADANESPIALRKKADEIAAYVEERLVDDNGVIYASLDRDTQRPWSKESLSERDDVFFVEGFEAWEVLNYENCGMTTGATLAFLSYQWRVEPTPEVYQRALRTFYGLHHIYSIGCQQEEGYFPKIYGGRLSHEISTDQYLYAIKGLMAWIPVAPEREAKLARNMVARMVDFWVSKGYRYSYFSIKDMLWPLTRFPSLLYAAHSVTGEKRYLDEIDRLHAEHQVYRAPGESRLILRAEVNDPFTEVEANLGGYYAGICVAECAAMDIMQLDECLLHSDRYRDEWLASMQISWREGTLSLTENQLARGMTYYDPVKRTVVDIPAGWLHHGPSPLNWDFLRWTGGFLTARSTMLARVGVHMAKWLPSSNAVQVVHSVLSQVALDQMQHYTDPDGEQLLPQHQFMTRWVDADAITNWLWAYWQGRAEGVISG